MAVGVVASSDAWAVLPDFVLEAASDRVRPAGVPGEGELTIHALWPKSHNLTPALARLLEETVAILRR